MHPLTRALLLAIAVLTLVACGDDERFLQVNVRTDFVPAAEFSRVSIQLGDSVFREYQVRQNDDFLRGVAVASFTEGLDGQSLTLRAQLFSADGSRLVERRVEVIVVSRSAATIVLTRSCQDVVCPRGDADATECDNGICVRPECSPENPAACEDSACSTSGDCPTLVESCGRVECTAGECLFTPTSGECGASQACVPGSGCVDVGGDTPDAGQDSAVDSGVDGGGDDGGGTDAGNDGGSCPAGEACSLGDVCELGVTDCSSGLPVCVSVGPAEAGGVCRASAGECDAEEVCDGEAPTCPPDESQSVGTPCSTGFCNGPICGSCQPGAACDPAGSCATGRIVCDGETPRCEATGFRPSSFECRPSAGPCDRAEMCTGSGNDCPGDGFSAGTTQCRGSGGACDVAEFCSGASSACPANAFRPDSFECRGSSGVCDRAESCTGSGASCPPDGFRSSAVECRASNGTCDLAETCTGSSAACPSDAFRSSSVQCRGSAGTCDVAETCTGSGANCPSNSFQSSGVECRASAGACDVAETCTGSSAGCPGNSFRPPSFICRAASGACDAVEQCTGSGASCPFDGDLANGTSCGSDICGSFGACTTTRCITASQNRTCSPQECQSGSCTLGSMYLDTQPCAVVNGMSCSVCGPNTSCFPQPNAELCAGECANGCCDDGVL